MVTKNPSGSLKILHLEDNSTFARRVEQKLIQEKILNDTKVVDSKLKLIEQLEKTKYDVVFLSDIISDSTGTEVLNVVKQMKPQMPVVIFSDILDEEVIVNCFINGVSNYVLKNNLERLGTVVRGVSVKNDTQSVDVDYQGFFNNSYDLLGICDKEGYFIQLNDSWSGVLGFSSLELKANPFIKFVHPDDLKTTAERFQQCFTASQNALEINCRFMTNSGEIRWLSWNTSLLSNGNLVINARDVTELKQKDFQLIQDRQNLKKLVELYKEDIAKKTLVADQIRDSVIITDLKGVITSWNKGSEKVFGYNPQESVGKHIAIIYPVKDYKYVQQEAANILLEQGPKDFELQMCRKNKEVFDARLTLDVTRDKSGRVNGMIGYAVDMGTSNKNKDISNNSHNYLEHVFVHSPLITFALNATENHETTFISGNVEQVLGYNAEKFLKGKVFWKTLLHQDDLKVLEEEFSKELKGKGKLESTIRLKRIDGEYRRFECSFCYVKDKDGNSLEIVGTWLDVDKKLRLIEELEHSKSKGKNTTVELEQLKNGMADLQKELEDTKKLYQDSEQKLSKSEQLRVKVEQETEISAKHNNSADTIQDLEAQLTDAKSIIEVRKHEIDSNKAKLTELESLLKEAETQRDELATELKESTKQETTTGQQLQNAKQELSTDDIAKVEIEVNNARQTKAEFIASISHEVRLALNGVLGFAQLLSLEENLTDKHKDFTHEITTAGNHVLGLMNEILDVTSLETGKIPLNCENFCIIELVDECSNLLAEMEHTKNTRINCVNDDNSISIFAFADRQRFKQALLNTLYGLTKSETENGSIEINVVKNKDNIRLKMSTPNEKIETKLEDSNLNSNGIDLLVTKSLLELMNGSIVFEFDPKKVISISIPSGKDDDEKNNKEDTEGKRETIADLANEQIFNVLCIETDSINIKLIESILAQRPYYKFIGCQYADKIVDMLNKNNVSLILLDMNIPETDSYELMKVIRGDEKNRDIPVIALSTNTMPGDIERSRDAGFSAYLTKPVEINRLLGAVEDLVFSVNSKSIAGVKAS